MTQDAQNPPEHDRQAESLRAFEDTQRRELAEFKTEQRAALEAFEKKEQQELEKFEAEHEHRFEIRIDRTTYTVRKEFMTGEEIRHVPEVAIGPERDLFEVVPGGSDKKILNDTIVEIHDGLRFFTAPAQINPGHHKDFPDVTR